MTSRKYADETQEDYEVRCDRMYDEMRDEEMEVEVEVDQAIERIVADVVEHYKRIQKGPARCFGEWAFIQKLRSKLNAKLPLIFEELTETAP